MYVLLWNVLINITTCITNKTMINISRWCLLMNSQFFAVSSQRPRNGSQLVSFVVNFLNSNLNSNVIYICNGPFTNLSAKIFFTSSSSWITHDCYICSKENRNSIQVTLKYNCVALVSEIIYGNHWFAHPLFPGLSRTRKSVDQSCLFNLSLRSRQ